MVLSCIVCKIERLIGRKSQIFFILHHFIAPIGGDPVGISWICLMPIKLEWLGYRMVKKTCDNMLTRFHLIPERDGQTDGWTDRQTDRRTDRIANCCINICASLCWRAIKTNGGYDVLLSQHLLMSISAICGDFLTFHPDAAPAEEAR